MSDIDFTCPDCHQSLEAPCDMAGQIVVCPSCKKDLRVPDKPARRGESSSGNGKVVVWVGCVCVALIFVFLVWFLAFRDTWERDNSARISETCAAVAELAKAGKATEVLAKYAELNELLGARQLKNAYLGEIVSTARRTGDGIQKEQDRQKKLTTLRTIEADGKRFDDESDWANASRKYGEVLERIGKNATGDKDLTVLMERITRAKQNADERAAEQRVREDTERKRKEEESRLASIRATIKGGAWLTKKAGNSEIIRGLKIEVLKGKTSAERVDAVFDAVVEGSRYRIQAAEAAEEFWAKACRESPGNEFMRTDLEKARLQRESVTRVEAARTNMVAVYRGADRQIYSDIGKLYKVLPEKRSPSEITAWSMLRIAQHEVETKTGIDGTYEAQAPGGDFYLYAIYESDYSSVEWMIPVTVTEAGPLKIDLHNDTAAFIRNKKD